MPKISLLTKHASKWQNVFTYYGYVTIKGHEYRLAIRPGTKTGAYSCFISSWHVATGEITSEQQSDLECYCNKFINDFLKIASNL